MNDRDYGFCPRCGALMRDGVCKSCGYSVRMEAGWQQPSMGAPGANWQQPSAGQPGTNWQQPSLQPKGRKKKRSNAAAWICGGIAVLFIGVIAISMVFSIRGIYEKVQKENPPGYGYGYDDGYFGYGNPYEDDTYGNYDDSYEDYEPSEKDDYYKEITDATSLDLDYQVVWESVSMRPDDSDNSCTYDCVYPVLVGEEDQEKFDAMSQTIEDLVSKYKDSYRDHVSGVSSYGYVTYMDEEKISVAIRHSFYEKKTTTPRVEAITLRVATGEVISHEEMAEVTEELVWQFRSRNSYQNGTVEFVDELSDEELMEYLKNETDSVMFYTPVGLEIGFNYEGGWVTVTLKTDTL